MAVFLTIDEGPQYFVGHLEVDGIERLDKAAILAMLSSHPGQPFSEFNVAVDRDTILAQYFDHGFPNATFEWSSKPAATPHRMDLRFTISEGTRAVRAPGGHHRRSRSPARPGRPQPPAESRRSAFAHRASPTSSAACTTWGSSRGWIPPSRTRTARPTASTCSTTWRRRAATPWRWAWAPSWRASAAARPATTRRPAPPAFPRASRSISRAITCGAWRTA